MTRTQQYRRLPAWGRACSLLGLALLAAPLAGGVSPASASANWGHTPLATIQTTRLLGTVQADLLRAARQHPGTIQHVIVQGQTDTGSMAAVVTRLGGHVTRDLTIIHAVAATLPGRVIEHLAATRGVRYVSPDGAMVKNGYTCCTSSNLQQVYEQAIGASSVWSSDQGQGIGVAVVDSGVNPVGDLFKHIVDKVNMNPAYATHTNDLYGHGTHVATIIAGDGSNSGGQYIGVAPQAQIINVRVCDDQGGTTISDVVNGLQWIYAHQSARNIRVVNLSLNSSVADSYQVDPLDAAVETLWKAGIVVVVSAGNTGTSNAGVLYAPANDPFVITVGAVDDHGSVSTNLHTLAPFSSYGTEAVSTTTGVDQVIGKPELVAPGVNIISAMASSNDTLAVAHPDHIVNNAYFRMSGTSMAAPMVSGAVALLLQAQPNLTPDQVKARLISTATPLLGMGAGAGEVNAYAAMQSTSTANANGSLVVAASLQAGNPAALWGSASWGSASWGSTTWGSASWGSASWGSASWGSASWGSASWGSDYWGK